TPSASASVTASRTPGPVTTRTPAPVPSFAQNDLVARVDLHGDTAGRFTTMMLSADGTYVTTSADWAADRYVRRLAAEGIALVRDRIMATRLFAADASYGLRLKPGADPPGHGASGVQVSFWDGTRVVHVGATLLIAGDERYYDLPPEAATLIALAQALRAPETWLPATAWRDAAARPYVAAYYRVVIGGTPAAAQEPPFDLAFVAWPFATRLASFGDVVVPAGEVLVGGPQLWVVEGPVRCAVLSRDDALHIRDALFAARAPIWTYEGDAFAVQGILEGRNTAFIAQPMLPASMTCGQDLA
ncbi:MAG TPA: hypothetical protein VI814_09035, partial [Candidatus Limnocylindria bacterium]